jgi:hypothetical protein
MVTAAAATYEQSVTRRRHESHRGALEPGALRDRVVLMNTTPLFGDEPDDRWIPCVSSPHPLACGHDEAIVFVHPHGLRQEVVTCTECDCTNAAFISYEEERW